MFSTSVPTETANNAVIWMHQQFTDKHCSFAAYFPYVSLTASHNLWHLRNKRDSPLKPAVEIETDPSTKLAG